MTELENYNRQLDFLTRSLPKLKEKYIGKPASFDQSRFTRESEQVIIKGTIENIDLAKGDASERIPAFLRATIRVSPTTTHLVDFDVVSVPDDDHDIAVTAC